MICFCSACHPTDFEAQCSRCGEEIRIGWRNGHRTWWHRAEADHGSTQGHMITPPTRGVVSKASRKKVSYEEEVDEDPEGPMPEPEVACHPVTVDDFPPRSGIRQIANLVGKTPGWEVRRFTASRGPYLSAKGSVLSISDSVVLGARGPEVDGERPIAVASWRDGKYDFGSVGTMRGSRISSRPASSTEVKAWIKENTE